MILLALSAVLGIAGGAPAAAQTALATSATIVQPALDGVFQGFEAHPLVGLSDDHGMARSMDFYAAVVRDPRFAREVGNLVVEFGAAAHQDIADRYVAGDAVPYSELRKIWTDTIGWTPTAAWLGFAKLLAAMRQTNRALPPARRIHVWLGEPPIDWSTATRAQVRAAFGARDSHVADVIERNILAHNRKALVIYGGFHFGGGDWLRGRVEARRAGAFYTIMSGYGVELNRPGVCAALRERFATVWPVPAMASAAPGAAADPALRDCATLKPRAPSGSFILGPGAPTPLPSTSLLAQGDAVWFPAPPEAMSMGPFLPDYLMDPGYRREMARRSALGGQPLIRFPPNMRFRRADYAVDLDAPGYAEAIEAMFAAFDKDGDGVVTAAEYVDPIP